MTDLDELAIPKVNLNGTSREAIALQLVNAITTLNYAISALVSAAPHGRDYQTLPGNVYKVAREQHLSRVMRLEDVLKELNHIAEAL